MSSLLADFLVHRTTSNVRLFITRTLMLAVCCRVGTDSGTGVVTLVRDLPDRLGCLAVCIESKICCCSCRSCNCKIGTGLRLGLLICTVCSMSSFCTGCMTAGCTVGGLAQYIVAGTEGRSLSRSSATVIIASRFISGISEVGLYRKRVPGMTI